MKKCLKCLSEKETTAFNKWYRGKDGLANHCKDCWASYYRNYYRKTIVRRKEMTRATRQRWRNEMLTAYGGKCVCCGESERHFLAMDHIYGGGYAERKIFKSPYALYKKLRDAGWPTGKYQILCHNCNMAKGFYGQCPHKKMVLAVV
jgi:hypothetical protein